jgi:ubiquinone/menaquinone biosynthesis C-methylase UbiE
VDHKEWVSGIFDRAAPKYGKGEALMFDYFGQRLVEQVSLKSDDHILDIGTGTGIILSHAAAKMSPRGRAVGVDLSSKMLKEASKRMYPLPVEFFLMDAEELLFPDHSFNLIFCGFCLSFFPALKTALREVRRVLKPGGTFAFTIMSQRPVLDAILIEKAKKFGVERFLGTGELVPPGALREHVLFAGFNQVDIRKEMETFWHDNPASWWDSIWSHGIRSYLEQLSPDKLAFLKKEGLTQAEKMRQAKGIPYTAECTYGFAD